MDIPTQSLNPYRPASTELVDMMINWVDAMCNIVFLIEHDCVDPAKVRSYVQMSREPLRCLQDALAHELVRSGSSATLSKYASSN
jgi:hypothetical protein